MRKTIVQKLKLFTMAIIITYISTSSHVIIAEAKENTQNVEGEEYQVSSKSKFDIADAENTTSILQGSNYGKFTLSGDINAISDINGFDAYEVKDSNVILSYTLNNTYQTDDENSWHLKDEKSNSIMGEKLESDILSGAVIIQTSFNGENWITDTVKTDIASDEADYTSDVYTSKDIQQVNGCYYKVIVAYKVERKIEDKQILFTSIDNFETTKYVEIYTFYLINSNDNIGNTSTASTTPRQELGKKIKTAKDSGYTGEEAIDSKDPHYGWDLGQFTVNGYTRATKDTDNSDVFLKNVGDKVTLWFTLKEDITALHGDSNLCINEDKDGSDQFFEVPKTNFKRGALLIRYTDFEGNVHEPIKYFDYLAANTRTGADTKVELFEEGDYEVALDYEILNKKGVNSVTSYRIYFTFKIRNGNCMVYPFDLVSGNELADQAVTENGFKLDMAKSRYLTVDVEKKTLKKDGDIYSEDIRFNRPAKDGESYNESGIYTFTVKNIYTNSNPTTKTIYVGNSPIYNEPIN